MYDYNAPIEASMSHPCLTYVPRNTVLYVTKEPFSYQFDSPVIDVHVPCPCGMHVYLVCLTQRIHNKTAGMVHTNMCTHVYAHVESPVLLMCTCPI